MQLVLFTGQRFHIMHQPLLHNAYCRKISHYSTALLIVKQVHAMCKIWIFTFPQLYSTFRFNLIYFRITEHDEALGQQATPNVYDCIKSKEGKQ